MKAKNETYVGPTTFRRFMETFKYLYNLKSQERTETVDQLKSEVSLEFKFLTPIISLFFQNSFLKLRRFLNYSKCNFQFHYEKIKNRE